MKLLCLIVMLSWGQFMYSQSALDSVYNVIHKTETGGNLDCTEISILLNSYIEPLWNNNIELSECRSGAIIYIMYNIVNLERLLCVVEDNNIYQDILFDELKSPVYEFEYKTVINNLNQIKKHKKLKKEMIKTLQQIDSTYKCNQSL